mmetsp:Transcript_38154/g.70413  ORF Transcript_38154/g.70413 Transcript_38154/m.70413 type:complete len:266 (+) Transcript_38154:222-1019(+)
MHTTFLLPLAWYLVHHGHAGGQRLDAGSSLSRRGPAERCEELCSDGNVRHLLNAWNAQQREDGWQTSIANRPCVGYQVTELHSLIRAGGGVLGLYRQEAGVANDHGVGLLLSENFSERIEGRGELSRVERQDVGQRLDHFQRVVLPVQPHDLREGGPLSPFVDVKEGLSRHSAALPNLAGRRAVNIPLRHAPRGEEETLLRAELLSGELLAVEFQGSVHSLGRHLSCGARGTAAAEKGVGAARGEGDNRKEGESERSHDDSFLNK